MNSYLKSTEIPLVIQSSAFNYSNGG